VSASLTRAERLAPRASSSASHGAHSDPARKTSKVPAAWAHAILQVVHLIKSVKAGLHNFETLYRPLVNEWQTIDNAGETPRLLSEGGQA
jgi:hypothetical protein